MTVDEWLESLPARHQAAMTRAEFLKAIRALSARYVERHGALPDRSPLDSAGKRAAFAGFYAPLHFVTAQRVIKVIGAPDGVAALIDAGCGTGVAGAAWAVAASAPPAVNGIDLNTWVLDEARVTWRALGLVGRSTRGNFVDTIEQLAGQDGARKDVRGKRGAAPASTGIIFGWSLNELDSPTRNRARVAIETLAGRGVRMLVLEPISRSLVPWWSEWAAAAAALGGRADEWRFADALPAVLSELSQEAGFSREELTVRSLTFNWPA